jgi:uncharacterized protein
MQQEKLINIVSGELHLSPIQIKKTVELLDDGNTIPFIARYRKEHTGSLDENQIRHISERIKYLRALEERKETILKSIKEQGKLTQELNQKITGTFKLQELEDLYLPYRPRKRTRATVARESGLEPLAHIILEQQLTDGNPQEIARDYLNPEKSIATIEAALQGARDIIAEIISEDAQVRGEIRRLTVNKGFLVSGAKDENRQFEMYFDYRRPLKGIPPHHILAINRGEKEGVLKIEIDVEQEEAVGIINSSYIKNEQSMFFEYLKTAIEDGYRRLLAPSITREVRAELTAKADEHAINVFGLNLRNLLLQPPVLDKCIMGIDPGFRTGCKIAVIDETGKYLAGSTIYPHAPQKQYFQAKETLREMIDEHKVDIIAIGNGTASRETELLIAELISEIAEEQEISYIIVNEAGASVYSTSKIAQKEFPDLEAAMRGNISIARRLQDPLAELVKIDPKSIGVGLYQHDVNQKHLQERLNEVVESCVNLVGVDLNTASEALLTYVSGLTKKSVENIIQFRDKNGRFINREELKEIDGIGIKAFQQAAGFLRIRDGENQLDATSIHPESYKSTFKFLKKFSIIDVFEGGKRVHEILKERKINLNTLAQELDCGLPTLEDIIRDLEKPGRDPRDSLPKPIFRNDVLKIEDLRPGMILNGTVRNVVDFGLFVDIGVKQDGLVHISQMTDSYVKAPHDVVQVGNTIQVKVLSIDLERQRIALTMKIKENK